MPKSSPWCVPVITQRSACRSPSITSGEALEPEVGERRQHGRSALAHGGAAADDVVAAGLAA
jgi:hypothetical protein